MIKPVTAYEADVNKDGAVNPGDQAIVSHFVGKRVPTVTPTATATALRRPIVQTYAGNGSYGAGGDGGRAIDASVSPADIAIGADGALLIADGSNNRIRKVDSSGNISTFAGTGGAGYCGGEGGQATDACLNNPQGLAVDGDEVYIASSVSHRVVRVSANGTIATVAGNGTLSEVLGGGAYCGDGVLAVDACLNVPVGLAIAPNHDLVIADTFNCRVRKVAADTGIITTIAGTGSCGEGADTGNAATTRLDITAFPAVDKTGAVYFTEPRLNRIRRVDSNGIITTVGGPGNGGLGGFCGDQLNVTRACFFNVRGLAFDAEGNLYVADLRNGRVRTVNPAGIITTIAGNGLFDFCGDGAAAIEACFKWPMKAVPDNAGGVYVVDLFNARVRLIR